MVYRTGYFTDPNVEFISDGFGNITGLLSGSGKATMVGTVIPGAIGNGIVDDTAAIQAYINASNGLCIIPSGTYLVSNLIGKSNLRITGDGGNVILTFKSGSTGYMIDGTGCQWFSVEKLTLNGGGTTDYDVDGTTAGNRSAIFIDSSMVGGEVKYNLIHGFSNIAIGTSGNSLPGIIAPKIINNTIYQCFFAITTFPTGTISANAAEYTLISANKINNCHYAISPVGGNTNVTGNVCSVNWCGIYQINADNNGHGTISGNIINHNTKYSLFLEIVSTGQTINGNELYFGDIHVNNYSGLILTGNLISAVNLDLNGSAPASFRNNIFAAQPNMVGNSTNWIFVGNRLLDGTPLTQEIEVLSDYINTGSGASLVANGTFNDATGWTLGTGWSIGAGVLTATAANGANYATYVVSATVGVEYLLEFTISNYTAGSIRFSLGGSGVSAAASGNGFQQLTFIKPSGGTNLLYLAPTTLSCNIDNLTLKVNTKSKRLYYPTTTVIGNSESHPSALLALNSTTGGFITPRMTQAQADAIINKEDGLELYITDATTPGKYGWKTGAWHLIF